MLKAVEKIVSDEIREWEGSPTELTEALRLEMAVNRLTKHLNVNASRLLEEHQVKYENKTKHAGRRIRLTYMVEAPMVEVVLCQDLVQVKMKNFSHFNPPEAQPQCVFFHTIVRIHLVTYSYNGYEFVSYCRKLPDIRKSSGMPACNREF